MQRHQRKLVIDGLQHDRDLVMTKTLIGLDYAGVGCIKITRAPMTR